MVVGPGNAPAPRVVFRLRTFRASTGRADGRRPPGRGRLWRSRHPPPIQTTESARADDAPAARNLLRAPEKSAGFPAAPEQCVALASAFRAGWFQSRPAPLGRKEVRLNPPPTAEVWIFRWHWAREWPPVRARAL